MRFELHLHGDILSEFQSFIWFVFVFFLVCNVTVNLHSFASSTSSSTSPLWLCQRVNTFTTTQFQTCLDNFTLDLTLCLAACNLQLATCNSCCCCCCCGCRTLISNFYLVYPSFSFEALRSSVGDCNESWLQFKFTWHVAQLSAQHEVRYAHKQGLKYIHRYSHVFRAAGKWLNPFKYCLFPIQTLTIYLYIYYLLIIKLL